MNDQLLQRIFILPAPGGWWNFYLSHQRASMSVASIAGYLVVFMFITVVIALPFAAHGLLGYVIAVPAAKDYLALSWSVIFLAALVSHLTSVYMADPGPPFLYTRKRKDGTTYKAYKVPGTKNLRIWRPPTWTERTKFAARPALHLVGRACLLGALLWATTTTRYTVPPSLVWTLYALSVGIYLYREFWWSHGGHHGAARVVFFIGLGYLMSGDSDHPL